MKRLFLELIDPNFSEPAPDWWPAVTGLFLKPGEPFEIRCWREETDLIRQALAFGRLSGERSTDYEVSVTGRLTPQLIASLPGSGERMTRFFTVASGPLWSAHYGRQLVLTDAPEETLRQVSSILSPIRSHFSILENDGFTPAGSGQTVR